MLRVVMLVFLLALSAPLKSRGYRFSEYKKREMKKNRMKALAQKKQNDGLSAKGIDRRSRKPKQVETAKNPSSGGSAKKEIEISLNTYNSPGSPKTYVAEITGTGGKYGLQRDFQQPFGGSRSASGKTGNNRFNLKEGKTYEIAEGYKDRRYVKIENGEIVPTTKPKSETSDSNSSFPSGGTGRVGVARNERINGLDLPDSVFSNGSPEKTISNIYNELKRQGKSDDEIFDRIFMNDVTMAKIEKRIGGVDTFDAVESLDQKIRG